MSEASVQRLLEQRGISTGEIKRSIEASLPYVVEQNERLARKIDRYEQLLTIIGGLNAQSLTKISVVDGVIEEAEFAERFYFTNRPLLMRGGCREMAAVGKWSPEFFKRKYGHLQIKAVVGRDAVEDPEGEMDSLVQEMSMSDFIDLISRKDGNDVYMVARNRNLMRPEFSELRSHIFPLPIYLRNPPARRRTHLWIGPKGTVTPFHFDKRNILFCQIFGSKRFVLASPLSAPYIYNHYSVFSEVDPESPDFLRHPLFRQVQTHVIQVDAGDILFLPVAWWHQVRSLSTSISAAISDFVYPNEFILDE
jgi:ribosomal protein L16 Arg81 hydroxylase